MIEATSVDSPELDVRTSSTASTDVTVAYRSAVVPAPPDPLERPHRNWQRSRDHRHAWLSQRRLAH